MKACASTSNTPPISPSTPRHPRQHPLLRRPARRRRGELPLSKRDEHLLEGGNADSGGRLLTDIEFLVGRLGRIRSGEMVTQSASENTVNSREIIGNKTERLNW